MDDTTLRVELTSPQPWFLQQVAHHSFLAVHQPTVEQFGEKWTEAGNIVTNGPFQLDTWEHNSRLDLVKWDEWRGAADVALERVNGRMITEGTTAVQAFEAGEVDETGIHRWPPARGDAATEGATRVRADAVARDLLLRRQRRQRPRREPASRDGARASTAARSSTTSRRPTSCPPPGSRRAACQGFETINPDVRVPAGVG